MSSFHIEASFLPPHPDDPVKRPILAIVEDAIRCVFELPHSLPK